MIRAIVTNNIDGRVFQKEFELQSDADAWVVDPKNKFGKPERWITEDQFTHEQRENALESRQVIIKEEIEHNIYSVDENGNPINDPDTGGFVIEGTYTDPAIVITEYKFVSDFTYEFVDITQDVNDKESKKLAKQEVKNFISAFKKSDIKSLSDAADAIEKIINLLLE